MNIYDIKIFIPSKNRLNNESTYNILKELNLEPILVVEPQEFDNAISMGFNCLCLDKNNQGITYARNFILKHARKYKYDYIAMLDDDIKTFGYIEKNEKWNNSLKQGRKKDNNAFITALEYFLKAKTCGTMQYTQFAWSQIKQIVFNRGIEVVWFLYMPLLNDILIEEDTIEDRDFSLEMILNLGIKTFRLNHLYFLVSSIGTNEGGIETNTRAQKQEYWSHKMQKKWGQNIISIIKKTNGWTNIKINWKEVDKLITPINRRQLTIFDALNNLNKI